MKPTILNNMIEESYDLFTRMKSGVRKAGLVALVGMTIMGVHGCKKEEPQKEDISPTESVEPVREYTPPTEPIVQEPLKEEVAPKEPVSLEEKLPEQMKIVFISSRDGDAGIYVMNADGSEQKHLSVDLAPVWSPDGKKIASQSSQDGKCEIYVMNADGNEQKNLTNNPAADQYPSWSPDGKKIAFASSRDGNLRTGNNEIYVMNADGQDIRRLTYSGIGSFVSNCPSWSPNGKKIAFHSYRDRNHEIYVMNADGSEQKNLTNNPAFDDEPLWSPDGKKIAFISVRDGDAAQMTPDQRREIYVMNADGSEPKNLTNNPGYDADLSWSPDGKKIAFDSLRDGDLEIYVMNADGSEQKRLTKDPAEDVFPSWSPDGKKIAFRSKRDENYEIYVMNADGSEQKNLTNNPAYDGEPSWSPFLPLENKTNEVESTN